MAEDLESTLEASRKLIRDASRPLGLWAGFRTGSVPNVGRRATILGLIEAARLRFAALARELFARFRKKVPGLGPWPRDFLATLAAGHHAAAMAATGTVDPAPADLEVVVDAVAVQEGFFARFRRKVARGKELISAPVAAGVATARRVISGAFVRRSGMYADAMYATGEAVVRARMVRDGFDLARWLLGPAEKHCSGCPAQAAKGLVPVDQLPAIGSQPCSFGCRCSIAYSHSASGLILPSPLAAGPAPSAGYRDGIGLGSPEALATRQRAREVLGVRSADEAMASLPGLVGAPDRATVTARVLGDDAIRVQVDHPDFKSDRTIYRDGDRLIIENSSFKVRPESQGKGIGADVFGRQVEQAARSGVSKIVAEAARDVGVNGYYTWPRFGFDAEVPAEARPALPPAFRDLPRVSDLMRTPEGRAAWKEHGVSTAMEFDLAEGSLSRRIWDDYRAEKARRAVP